MQKSDVRVNSPPSKNKNKIRSNNTNARPVAYAFAYVNSPRTMDQYPKRLKMFFDFCGIEPVTPPDAKPNVKTTREESEKRKQKFMEGLEQQARTFLDNARQDDIWASEQLIFYLDDHKKRVIGKEISAGTLHNLLKPIKKFLRAYKDVYANIDWDRIGEALPKPRQYSHDRCPTMEEIRKLVQFPDHNRRLRPIVYVMCSSGIRLGAWDFMKVKHIIPIADKKNPQEIVAAKLLVYAGEDNDEYITYMTGEAYKAVKEYLDFRASYGEKITGESWVMRTEFSTTDVKRTDGGNGYGNISKIDKPEKFSSDAIGRSIVRALQKQGIRDMLPEGQRRHDFRGVHGFRKWYKTRAEQAMLRTNVELLMGHDIGLSTSYYKASEQELLTDYLKAIPYLSIYDENAIDIKTLKEEQLALERKTQAFEQRDQQKDKQLEALQNQLQELRSNVDMLIKQAKQQQEVHDFIMLGDPEKLEQEIRSFLYVGESEDGKTAYYSQDYPELTLAAEKMRERTLAANKKFAALKQEKENNAEAADVHAQQL